MFHVPTGVGALMEFLEGRRSMVLTGAGISTDSGIPDYRGVHRRRPAPKPMTFQEFTGAATARQRYWARSAVGWGAMADRLPNPSHFAVTELERLGLTTGTVTQNVDGLHRKAGSRALIELHGDLAQVTCLACGTRERRDAFQARLLELTPGFASLDADILPDGDAALDPALTSSFRVPVCTVCGGVMKPDVIFFGENVPRARVEQAGRWLEAAEALLVLGSSLEVFSGYRFVKAALVQGKPVAVVNQGPTRADGEATLRVEAPLAEVLPQAAELLAGASEAPAPGTLRS
ncbi:MAG TPA: NAD-dependent protein deacetylase [Trueperaceae bacterium]|nr:NAD-dependent protein deacetylase [Trueperaceae bacterium]